MCLLNLHSSIGCSNEYDLERSSRWEVSCKKGVLENLKTPVSESLF